MKILQARDNRDRLTCDHVERLLGDIVDNIDPSVDVVKPNIINSIVVSTDVPRKLERPVREMITFQEESDQYIVEMYRSSTFMWTWNGTHHGRTVHDTKHVTRDVVYLHYHAVGMQRQIERARTICIGYGYIRDADTDLEILHKLARLGNVCGIHRVKEYMSFLRKKIIIDAYVLHFGTLPSRDACISYMRAWCSNNTETIS